MSLSPTTTGVPARRLVGQQNGQRLSTVQTRPRKKSIDWNDAYLYALRVAYLAYLLQPRAKRSKPLPKPPIHRSTTSTSIHDLMKDFSGVRDSKSSKYPHGFVRALEKRLQGILTGVEKRPEYQDGQVKRTFAIFLNTLSEPSFKKQMEDSKRAEDLVLMFFSKTTNELSKGKPPHDDGVKRMVDRHVALFVRLLSLVLRDKGWAEERRDLAARLQNLEKKLLAHEEDLSETVSDSLRTTVEEEIPLSYDVKDMPLVQIVGQMFGMRNTMLQSDIDKNKPTWTEEAALKDLKTYQAHLNVGTRKTLSSVDFDTDEAYEAWKKAETPDLSQMMLAIIQTQPHLAKSSLGVDAVPQFNPQRASLINDGTYSELSKTLSPTEETTSSYAVEMPDLSGLKLEDGMKYDDENQDVYTFIPLDPRAMFRFLINLALTHDLQQSANNEETNGSAPQLLSKESTELLNEIALRWRIPKFTRIVLFLDCVKEQFVQQSLDLHHLDAAFNYIKEPVVEDTKHKRASLVVSSVLNDRYKWTIADFSQMQQTLSSLHDALLREMYAALMTCYDSKQSPLLGLIPAVIEEHIQNDPSFAQSSGDMQHFNKQVVEGLANKAREVYSEYVDKEIPAEQESWEFYHIMELGKKVLALAERIRKRYRRNPEVFGVNPLMILLESVLPSFAADSRAMVEAVVEITKSKGEDIPIEHGFLLYTDLSKFRRVYADSLLGQPFPYKVEDLLQEFVWKWVEATNAQMVGWVEQAVRQDHFQVRTEDKTRPPSEDERHSTSVIDVFRSFSQVIEQIVQLEWDDDLTYAKFMTALAKAVGAGITRYCELLDQMFGREMDRLTPEQEAAASQTRQEKWMQYAKDSWNGDKRVEPFHFYPESFVKLNDISFAILQWDKLEREVNVDACAEVIKKHTPPAVQRQRKTSNYVFTIKVVEAEGLKALDVNGFSDPYVVLTDEYQKRLFKTKIVYRNLNPRWDESVDITTQGPLNLIATVWDWDAMKDHDYVGRTSLKLDPSHFGDFLPREYWLDLDTQGRILIRVSMEGERDDIQFYFAKAFRALQRTQRDMTRKITDKLSAYISYCLSQRTLRSLLSRGISVQSISKFMYGNRASVQPASTMPSDAEILNALKPLYTYFDDNFFIMNQTLTSDAMLAVMTRLWKEVLVTIEALLVPPLSDKPSQQKPLAQPELDVVFKWLQSLFDFFHAVDEETGEANGVPINVLKSPKYHEIQTLNFFYFDTTENLVRTSERMASATALNAQAQRTRLSAPPTLGASLGGGLLAAGSTPGMKRAKSIMIARNLGTKRKAKEEKWKQAQAEPSDDMILRILRMRPEAAGYLRDRSRQKERLAAAAAAEMIVRQSLAAGGGRMTGPSVIRR